MMSRVCSYTGFCLFELILCTEAVHLTRLKQFGRTGGDAALSGFSQASVTSVTFFADMCQCSLAKMIYDMICVKVYTVYTDCVCFVLIPNWPVDLTIVSRSDTVYKRLLQWYLSTSVLQSN